MFKTPAILAAVSLLAVSVLAVRAPAAPDVPAPAPTTQPIRPGPHYEYARLSWNVSQDPGQEPVYAWYFMTAAGVDQDEAFAHSIGLDPAQLTSDIVVLDALSARGWEVVQFVPLESQGSASYLLKRIVTGQAK